MIGSSDEILEVHAPGAMGPEPPNDGEPATIQPSAVS